MSDAVLVCALFFSMILCAAWIFRMKSCKRIIPTTLLIFSLIISSVFLSAPSTSQAASLPKGLVAAKIAKEVDGDSIYVTLNHKRVEVRMLLIDTPETHDPRKPVEPFGPSASNYAKKMLPVGAHVKLQLGKAGYRYDKYHRLLAFIYTSKGSLYNYSVVKKGLARVAYVYKPNTQHLSSLNSAQAYAKTHKLGIWSRKGYVTSTGYNFPVKKATKKAPVKKTTSTSQGGLKVQRGQYASITVKAKRGTRGTIKVYYNSGASKAKGLESKKASSSGSITWKWKVGTNTKPGTYRVVTTVGGKSQTHYLRVY